MASSQPQKLRAKTGCFTCRQRRVKCDETPPVCRSCRIGRRECKWPAKEDLLDRRFASHTQSRHQGSPDFSSASEGEFEPSSNGRRAGASGRPPPGRLLAKAWYPSPGNSIAQDCLHRDIKNVVYKHFSDSFISYLFVPGCQRQTYFAWFGPGKKSRSPFEALYYASLACAASHFYYTNSTDQMRQLGITYYSDAVTKLSKAVAVVPQSHDDNGMLMAIMLLCVHGMQGGGTYSDIVPHLEGAKSIFKPRLLQPCHQMFDILYVESILYMLFHLATENRPKAESVGITLDLEFWDLSEVFMGQAADISGETETYATKSPIMGVPLRLVRFVLLLHQRREAPDETPPVEELRAEVARWRNFLEMAQRHPRGSDGLAADMQANMCRDLSSLYVIVACLLLSQESPDREMAPSLSLDNTQLFQRAIRIISRYSGSSSWAKYPMGSWVIHALGLFASYEADIDVLRADLRRRLDYAKLNQVERLQYDLEALWSHRQHSKAGKHDDQLDSLQDAQLALQLRPRTPVSPS